MIASNHAVRLGLRAASRNPELAFGRALMEQAGSLLSILPPLLAVCLAVGALDRDLRSFARTVAVLSWPVFGGIAAALLVSFTAGMAFWSGALPLLAADVELDRRPPPGHFVLLAARGFARVFPSGLLSQLLSVLVSVALGAAALAGIAAALARPSVGSLAAIALVVTLTLAAALLVDLLGRFWILRAAAFGEGPSAAFGKAASLLSARLGQAVIVSAAFFLLEIIAAAISGALAGIFSGPALLGADTTPLVIVPRIALGLAFAAVFSWLEVGRMGALAAIVCDVEGLIGPSGAEMVATTPPAEPVVEAIADEPVLEALPAPADEPVIDALSVPEDDDNDRD